MMGFRYVLIILSLLLINQSSCSSGKCIEEENDEDNQGNSIANLQQLNFHMKWLADNHTSREEVENVVGRRLNRTFDGSYTTASFEVIDWRVTYGLQDMRSYLIEATFKSDRKALFWRSLTNIIDCSEGCIVLKNGTSNGTTLYELRPSSKIYQLTYTDRPSSGAIILISSMTVEIDEAHSTSKSKEVSKSGDCEICTLINEAVENQGSGRDVGMNIYNSFHHAFIALISILDPHHWLFLFVGIWLTTCCIIAMLIKKRDKRRLRLFLEERTDYSFSAKR